jgi:hypothetical protein
MAGSVDIAVNGAGDKNVDSPDVACNFSALQYADRCARVFASDDIKPDMAVNVNAAGKTQEITVDMRRASDQRCHHRLFFLFFPK